MNQCKFCGDNPQQVFTWDMSNSKADIYLSQSFWAENADGIMTFVGDFPKMRFVPISYCPFCGRKLPQIIKRPKKTSLAIVKTDYGDDEWKELVGENLQPEFRSAEEESV